MNTASASSSNTATTAASSSSTAALIDPGGIPREWSPVTPWSQQPQQQLHQHQQQQQQDWGALFASPLNPSMFAALTANGVIGPVPPTARPYVAPLDVNLHQQSPSPASSWSHTPPFPSALKHPLPRSASSKPVDDPTRLRGSATSISFPSPIKPNPYPNTYINDRPNLGLPPSLWMSPAQPTPTANYPPLSSLTPDPSTPLYAQSPTTPASPSADTKSTFLTDIFSDDLLSSLSDHATSPFTSPRISGSPELQYLSTNGDALPDPEQLAKDDPLATQVWKMYARTKATLPQAQRMENLTWRMMALTMRKKKEEEYALRFPTDSSLLPPNHLSNPLLSHSSDPTADDREPDERGRRIDKGKARVRVVGFDGTNQDGHEDEDVSLPEPITRFSAASTATTTSSKDLANSPGIPIPGTSRSPIYSNLPPRSELASVYEDPTDAGLFEPLDAGRYLPSSSSYHHHHHQTLSGANSPSFAPSSLPSFGLHGLPRIPTASSSSSAGPMSQEGRTFPRHVRKTSFDHTVSKENMVSGLAGGRHQVNGKAISPDTLVGIKRRAEAPHVESMLRADPSAVGGEQQQQSPIRISASGHDADQFDAGTASGSFPSSSFSFAFPPYDALYDMNGSAGDHHSLSHHHPSQHPTHPHHSQSHPYLTRSGRASSLSSAYPPTTSTAGLGSPVTSSSAHTSNTSNEGLSARAAAASAVLAEGYAQLNAANLASVGVGVDVDEPILDYRHLIGFAGYHSLDSTSTSLGGVGSSLGGLGGGGGQQGQYTHVDPAQILASVDDVGKGGGGGGFVSFHESPSSDWIGSSTNASPEPYSVSNASSPPSTEGGHGGTGNSGGNGGSNGAGSSSTAGNSNQRHLQRKVVSMKSGGRWWGRGEWD
ncbi:hypothetical protein ONZ45_g15115 [Pleurotus djamor]|nr:hypothetical protein ONZ45_g15115 [Pleurotus djamor]